MSGSHGGDHAAEGFLVSAMWSYARHVLYPAQALKRLGLPVGSPRVGDPPLGPSTNGLGPRFSREYPQPVLLDRPTSHDHLVDEFDRMAEIYDAFVQPFSRPIFDEALREMAPYLPPDTRALDAGCGAGRELQQIAQRVPRGEVVGIDLAAGMVNAAYRSARAHGLTNCAFFQSDVSELPELFNGQFDLVYNSLAHHHYPEPAAATAAIFRCLRPGGV
jgi:SAM-dependent methyltransferase